ncbi:MAG TPA: alpha-L-fucosidase [Phototrophicaceae bacterium]|nr:alpha-L-fucosidase [Phototrophicaceae bacterium]
MTAIEQVITSGPFQASWDSLKNYTVPDWYQDAKFGIFIHWGLYAVPAFGNEWYPRNMYLPGSAEFKHHVETYGPHTKFGYKDFIPLFKAENYDPDQWAQLFKKAGARYVVPVAEHHDGFAMYDSALSDWTAAKMGPKRDLIGELAQAVRQHDLIFGVSNHRAEHWWFLNGGMQFDSDVQDEQYRAFYGPARPGPRNWEDQAWFSRDWEFKPDAAYLADWLARNCELVDKYQPQLVWFDWWIEQNAFAPYLQQFAAYYYNRGAQWNRGVAINYKLEAFPEGTAVFDVERGQLAGIRPLFWQTDTAVSKNSWGYIQNQDYKTAADIVADLVDIVSKNGSLLLNIGPRPDGTIPEPEQQLLLAIGDWLALNGEAIHDTRPWKIFGEGPTQISEGQFTDTQRSAFTGEDIRFTTKGDTLYATALAWPGNAVTIKTLGRAAGLWSGEIADVQLLGYSGQLTWQHHADGLTIQLPDQPPGHHAFVFKIKG